MFVSIVSEPATLQQKVNLKFLVEGKVSSAVAPHRGTACLPVFHAQNTPRPDCSFRLRWALGGGVGGEELHLPWACSPTFLGEEFQKDVPAFPFVCQGDVCGSGGAQLPPLRSRPWTAGTRAAPGTP